MWNQKGPLSSRFRQAGHHTGLQTGPISVNSFRESEVSVSAVFGARMPRIVYLTAGAGGMYCGSCLNDNAMAKALPQFGWDTQLVPCYTPIRTDETDTSIDQVFFGGINVWLQQQVPLFRWLPAFADRFLDNPKLIRRVTSSSVQTSPKFLGQMARSMLQGVHGRQRKEVRRLVDWLSREAKPDVVVISNILIAAFVDEMKRKLNCPVVVMLQGDDVFLEMLSASDREACLTEIRRIAQGVDRFVTHSEAYRGYIANYLGIDIGNIDVAPLGLDTADYESLGDRVERESGLTIGYLARLAPEKGLHRLVQAFIALKQSGSHDDLRLRIAGWLGPESEPYAQQQWQLLEQAGLKDHFEYLGVVNRQQKLDFLRNIDILSVPTVQREPKGLFVLESMAAGTPVVLPDHGAFPEIILETGGGTLFSNADSKEFVFRLNEMLTGHDQRKRIGRIAREFVLQNRTTRNAAQHLDTILRKLI